MGRKQRTRGTETETGTSQTRGNVGRQHYFLAAKEAVQAFHQGRHRDSADKYLQAVTDAVPSHGVWASQRWHFFHGYNSILREQYFAIEKSDFKTLQSKFVDNEEEPFLIRSHAAFTMGLLKFDAHKREEAAEFYRQAISFADQAPASERQRTEIATVPMNGQWGEGEKSVASLLEETRTLAVDNLGVLENPRSSNSSSLSPSAFVRSDGTNQPRDTRRVAIPMNDPSLEYRVAVGGKECDCCHKTTQEVGMVNLLLCTRCKMAYYCSEACQKKQWRAGHKHACRTKHQIENGDHMKIEGLVSRSELNGNIVQVVGPDSATPGRWKVKHFATAMSIKGDNLFHIRPAM